MGSQDDLALLKRMYEQGEISGEQYDMLRRHVLWGTPLPSLMDDVPGPDRYVAGASAVDPNHYPRTGPAAPPGGGRHSAPNGTGFAGPGYTPAGRPYASRRERREAEEAAAGNFPPPAPPANPPAGNHTAPPDNHRVRTDDPPATSRAADRGFAPPPDDRTPDPPLADRGFPPPSDDRTLGSRAADRGFPPPPDDRTPDPPLADRGFPPPSDDRTLGWQDADRGFPTPSDDRTPGSRGADRGVRAVVEDSASASVYPLGGSGAEPATRRWADELAERRDRRGSVRSAEPEEADEQRPQRKGRKAPHRRSLLTVLTSLVVALALVAAGVWWFALRKEGVPPSAYARETCGSVRDWQQAVDSSNAALVTQIAREKDRSKIRTAVTAYYGTIAARTDQLQSAILAHGAVDLTDGQAYADSLAAAIGDQARTLRDLAARADRLDPADPTAFQTTLPTLLTGADTAVSEVSAALARPAAGITTELRSALSDDPSCAPYVG